MAAIDIRRARQSQFSFLLGYFVGFLSYTLFQILYPFMGELLKPFSGLEFTIISVEE